MKDAYYPGDTATVRLDDLRLNGVKVYSGAVIMFDVYDGDVVVANGSGVQDGTKNNWLLMFNIPLTTVPPTTLKVESVTVYEGASKKHVALVPVGVE